MSNLALSSRRALLIGAGSSAAFAGASRLALAKSVLTLGFIYVGAKDDYGYNQAHAEGAAAIKSIKGIKVVEEERVSESLDVEKTMESMINLDEASLIFPTSFGYFDPFTLREAVKHPEVQFRHAGGLWKKDKDPKNAGSYFGYIGECVYLSGIVAGHTTKTKKLGFVAAKPIPQVLQNINSFLLGARSVDPTITVQVIFTGDWSLPVKEAEATNSLVDSGADVITCHVDGPKVVIETAERRGAYTTGYHVNQQKLAPKGYLTGAEWNWVTPYKMFAEDALGGKPLPNFLRGGLAQNFVKTSAYGAPVKEAARKQASDIKATMLEGKYAVFKGPLKDNRGAVVIPGGTAYQETAIDLESMNYLVEGVIGSIA